MNDTTSDLAALYRAILAKPAEDTPRLMYADELDSIGGKQNAGHAKMIRLTTELHRQYGDEWRNGWVEKHLLRNWKEWWAVPPLISPVNPGTAQVRTPYELKPYPFKNGMVISVHHWVPGVTSVHSACNYHFQRGFFSHARVPWHHWEMFGDTVTAHTPIASVKLTTYPFQQEAKIAGRTRDELELEILRARWPTVADWQLP